MTNNKYTPERVSPDNNADSLIKVSTKSSINRKIIIILLVIFAIALACGFYGYKQKDARIINQLPKDLDSTQQAIYLSDKGHYGAAQKVWHNQFQKATSIKTKQTVLFQQSALALKFKKYDEAKKYAETSKELRPKSSSPYVSLAHHAEAIGDVNTARQSWRLAIDYLDPNDPSYSLIKRDYQISLESLK